MTGGTTVDAPPTDRAADDDGSGIGLDRLADARDLPVATDHDCTLSDGSHLACGPTLAADGVAPTQLLTHDGLLLLRRDGDLTAFGLPDLEQRWRTALDPDIERWSLQDGDGLVLLTTPTTVHALDPHDGQVRWRSSPARLTTADGTAGDQRRSSFHPIETWVRDGTVLALDAAGTLTALAAEDGSQRWSVGDAGRRPVATPQGVVVFDDHGARAWSTNDPQPRWEVVDALLDVRRPVARDAVPGPMPLTRNRGLLDLTTGAITTDARLGATRFLVLPEVTIELRWPSGTKRAEVAALEPDGTTRWRRSDQPISCCDTTAALTATDEVAITSTDRHPVIYDLDDGGAEVLPARGGAELIGLDATTAVWRADDGLVATDRHSGRERFRSSGELRSIDPLLIAVDDGLVVPDERARARDSHVRRPTARTLTAHPA
ncbi:MAG: PQQ-binding-like beta-propeller repeat protein [Nitriliruptoraceae bacterium]